MRRCWFIFLLGLCLLTGMRGLSESVVSPNLPRSAASLTNIAVCLEHAQNHPGMPDSLDLEADVTLVDRERNLVVLQDDAEATGVYVPSSELALKPGQRVRIEGAGVFPYVRAFPKYPDEPSSQDIQGSFESSSGHGTYFLSRLRGYLYPPVTGQYTFWISADDAGEFFLSPDASPERMQRIATNKIGNATGPGEWDRYPSQRSQPVTLRAGEAYYVEARQVQGYGRDYLAVAWEGPGMKRELIDARWLIPLKSSSESAPLMHGLLRESWTNFFVRDYSVLESSDPHESIVKIHSLKITLLAENAWPVAQPFSEDARLAELPNLRWVELEGRVDFAATADGRTRLELKTGASTLDVHVLSGMSTERLMDAQVRVRGVLEHGHAPAEESSVLWVPDARLVTVLRPGEDHQGDLSRVSICEITPANPQMSWGRRLSVRGRIIDRTSDGLIVVKGEDNYQAFCSSDGTNWFSLGEPVELGMSNTVQIGLVLASQSATDISAASFADLEGLRTNWQSANVGNPTQSGEFSIDHSVLTMRGSGKRIGARADQQYFVHQSLEGETEISVHLTDFEPFNSHSQVGLMIRESLDARAPFAAVLFAQVSGPTFQYRRITGDPSVGFEASMRFRQFRWMKLTKRKSILLVQGKPGAEISTNQDVEITGALTWRNETPILSDAFFEVARKDISASQLVVSQSRQTIADFVAQAQHPPEPYLSGRMTGSGLHGTVTFCRDYQGTNVLFVQEGNEGAMRMGWSDAAIKPTFKVGQSLEINGYAEVRQFPVVFEPSSLKPTGWGTLPEPEQYSSLLVKSGNGQARWVEATGVVRSAETNGLLQLTTKEGPLTVWLGKIQTTNDVGYIDSLVRMRGVLSMDAAHKAQLLIPSREFVEVRESAPTDPFATPRFSIAQLAALDVKPERLRRMKSVAVVTCSLRNGVYVQDNTGGAYVQTSEASGLRPGDQIEAVGFPSEEANMLMLTGASIRKDGKCDVPKPRHISLDELLRKQVSGQLVCLEGTLLEVRDTSEGQLLTLQNGTRIFEASRWDDQTGLLPPIAPGSRVSVTGVSQIDQSVTHFGSAGVEAARSVTSLRIWLPTSASVTVLQHPPWWTLKRAAWVGGLLASGFLAALVWGRMLRRRVALRTQELQSTMGRLEKETRTSAMLAERDRLAGEIHDSLEQGLTAIMLQLDAAHKYSDQSPEARKFVRMARNMAEFSRSEVQHAVWDMQSPLLENADLANALKHVVSQISSGSPEIKIEILGSPRPLPSSHEHHLLRIAQEAITNAIKHAEARNIQVTLDYSNPDTKLTIRDDGKGFAVGETKPQGQSGHFGLQGIRARAKKIEARIDIVSQIGKGTSIAVQTRPIDKTSS
jgi:signal transduction histidine kinase